MSQHLESQQEIRQYLLGELPEPAQQQFEQRLLVDAPLVEELAAGEDELIDDYLDAALDAHTHARFEQYFLSAPERQRKLRFARTLRRYVAAQTPTPQPANKDEPRPSPWATFLALFGARRPFLRFALAAVLVVAVAGGALLIKGRLAARRGPALAGANVYPVTLAPGLTREGGDVTKVNVPAATDYVQLRLALPGDEYPRYRAQVSADDGQTVCAADDLKSQTAGDGRVVSVDCPVARLQPGDYRVRLSGTSAAAESEGVGTYNFRLLK